MTSECKPAKLMLQALRLMIEGMSEAVLVIDHPGRVVAANRAALDLLDLHEQRAALRPLDEYDQLIRSWSVGGEPFAPTALRRALDGETIPRQVATISTGAGIEHIIQFTATPIRDERGRVILAMLSALDITREERSRGYWLAVATAARALSGEVELGRVLEVVLDQMAEALGGELAIGVWQAESAEGRLRLLASRGLGEQTVVRLSSVSLDCPSLICEAGRVRQTRHVDDARLVPPEHELDRRLAEEENLGSLTVAPLLVKDQLLGVMAYGLHASHRLYEEDLQAVNVVTGLFAEAIDRAQLHEEMRELNRRLMVASVREQELAEEAERQARDLDTIIQSIADAVFVCDALGHITLANNTALALIGKKQGELLGTTADWLKALQLRFPDGRPVPVDELAITRALRDGVVVHEMREVGVHPHTQQPIYLSISAAPLYDETGGVIGAVEVARDITELAELDRLKDEFISIAAHELKTPVTSLRGFAQTLLRQYEKRGAVEPERLRRALQVIDRQSLKLTKLLSLLLDSSLLDGERPALARQLVDLVRIVETVVAAARLHAERHTLVVKAPSRVDAFVDPLRIEQVITNLLDNAIRYSPAGGPVEITVAVGNGVVQIAVRDHGIGISPEHRPHVFERFYRAHEGASVAGLGLGLYISKEIVTQHGGRIEVECPPDSGTRFVVSLPVGTGASGGHDEAEGQ